MTRYKNLYCSILFCFLAVSCTQQAPLFNANQAAEDGLPKRVVLESSPTYRNPTPYHPSQEVLDEVEALLASYLKLEDPWLYPHLGEYLGQYKGVVRDDANFVQGTFFCREAVGPDWREEPMVFYDGADTNFTFLVDVARKEVTEFMTGGNYKKVTIDGGQTIVVRRGCNGATNYDPHEQ